MIHSFTRLPCNPSPFVSHPKGVGDKRRRCGKGRGRRRRHLKRIRKICHHPPPVAIGSLGGLTPPPMEPQPKMVLIMRIEISNKTKLNDMPEPLSKTIQDRLTFQNPKWVENNRMGRWNGETPRDIHCYENGAHGGLIVLRGVTGQVLSMCKRAGISIDFVDSTRSLDPVDIKFNGKMRPYQKEAVNGMLAKRFGILDAPTSRGKTIIGLHLIATGISNLRTAITTRLRDRR